MHVDVEGLGVAVDRHVARRRVVGRHRVENLAADPGERETHKISVIQSYTQEPYI